MDAGLVLLKRSHYNRESTVKLLIVTFSRLRASCHKAELIDRDGYFLRAICLMKIGSSSASIQSNAAFSPCS